MPTKSAWKRLNNVGLGRPLIHPGELLLEEFLKPRQCSQTAAAAAMQMPLNRLNEIIRGRRSITPATALRLAAYLNTTPEMWLHAQAAYDLERERRRILEAQLRNTLVIGLTLFRYVFC